MFISFPTSSELSLASPWIKFLDNSRNSGSVQTLVPEVDSKSRVLAGDSKMIIMCLLSLVPKMSNLAKINKKIICKMK
jgi:hypothetical protein